MFCTDGGNRLPHKVRDVLFTFYCCADLITAGLENVFFPEPLTV